ncbi:MAG: Phosphoglycolate phosphatase [Pseudomonadota bacterium]
MTHMHWKAVLFDLDGTLVETAPEIADAVNATLQQLGWPEVEQADVDRWIGHGTRELLILALAHLSGQSPSQVRDSALLREALPLFDVHYQAHCGKRSQLYPHVRETLSALRQRGCRIAVVTNKEGRYTDTVLRAHDLQDEFDAVISGDTYPTKKPDPSSVQALLKKWGIDPSQALFVGDSSIDAATARNAGLQVWLLPYGYNMGESVEDCGPDRVIGDVSFLIHSSN